MVSTASRSDCRTVRAQRAGVLGTARRREAALAYACLTPWVIGFLVFEVGAMAYSLYLAFCNSDMLTGTVFVGLANFEEMIDDPLVGKSLSVTGLYAVGAVPLGVITSLAIALMLNEKVPLQGLLRTLYYLPSVVSGISVAILWAWMFNPRVGLINTALALLGLDGPTWIYSEEWALPSLIIMSLWGVGGNMLLYLAGLQNIPTQLYEAAKIDGAGALRRLAHITIPMLTPTLFFTLVMGVIGAFQFFTESYVMTNGGPNNATLSIMLYIYRKSFQQLHFGYASALAWLLFVIIMLCTLLVIRSSALWVYYEGELAK